MLKRPALDHENPLTDYRASLDLLMRPSKSGAYNEEISRVINHRDELKNSPLHYATQQWDQVGSLTTKQRLTKSIVCFANLTWKNHCYAASRRQLGC